MTFFEAQILVDNEQEQFYYSTSPLNTGKVDVITVGENGFIYRRETEYIEVVGVAEMICDYFTIDISRWNFSEVVVHRKIDIGKMV